MKQSFSGLLPSSELGWIVLLIIFISGVLLIPYTASAQSDQFGRISGILVDAQTDEPLIGANVYLEGTTIGAGSDLDGFFLIENAPPGLHDLIIDMIGYAETKLTAVEVTAGKMVQFEKIKVLPEAIEGEEVVVEARFIQQTEAAVLSQRKSAQAISDGLSSEAISQSGASKAADAMQQVTGASVIGGKYVYVRGLGDRYAVTMLNGAELPSADPDKRSFNFDLVPSNLLENIITTKTFTPDRPGNFSGGAVNMGMNTFPERLKVNFSSGLSWNSQSSLNPNFLTYPGGNTDWLGFDDGSRDLPDIVQDKNVSLPNEVEARRNPELAQQLNQASKAFAPVMAPQTSRAPFSNNFSLSMGNQTLLWDRPLGYLASLSYSRDYSFYEDGKVGRWKLTGSVDKNDSLANLIDLQDSQGIETVLWGAIATMTYQLRPGHEIQGNLLRTQSGISEARYLVGPWQEQNVDNFETRVLNYKERALTSWQLRGKNEFKSLAGLNVNWMGSLSNSTQDEPDARYFSDTFSERTIGGRDTVIYSISPSIIRRPGRYFRNLEEKSRSAQIDLTLPLRLLNERSNSQLKFGYSYEEKDRNFEERLFEYWQGNGYRYMGDPEEFFAAENAGVIGYDSTRSMYLFGNYIQEALGGYGGDYRGDQQIHAAYLMMDAQPWRKLRLVGGIRLESTRMLVTNDQKTGELDDEDWLPSVNATYRLSDDMSLRAAYGRTLARPNFREKAPYASFEFVNDYIFNGNPDLKRTLIDNYDLRWEWFLQPGEVLSVSAFYKDFRNPIEKTIDVGFSSEGALVYYDNTERATVYGLEFEMRKRLDVLNSRLKNFLVGSNLSIIHSEVNIPERELISIRGVDPNADPRRELQGQSPYIINVNFTYENPGLRTVASLYYNVFGERLSEVSLGGTPGVYEQPFHLLNFTFSQHLISALSLKFSAKNLLESSHRFVQEYKGVEYVRREYRSGRSFALGLEYALR